MTKREKYEIKVDSVAAWSPIKWINTTLMTILTIAAEIVETTLLFV